MAPKAKKDAPPAKLDKKAKAAAKSEKTEKTIKGAKTAALEVPPPGTPGVDPDELEEAEDEAAAAAGRSSSNDAALAAAGGTGEMSASFKNFRHHPDMENFYRFIYENDLRHEALAIIDEIMIEKRKKKALKIGKAAH